MVYYKNMGKGELQSSFTEHQFVILSGGGIMLNLFYIEFMKLKRSKILYVMPIPALVAVFTDFSPILGGKGVNLSNYYFSARIHTIILSIAYFALLTSYIFTREYKDGTIYAAFTCTVSRSRIFITKLLIQIPVMLLTYLWTIPFIITFSFFIKHSGFCADIFIKDIEIIAVSVLLNLLILPFFALISILTRNIIPAFLTGGAAMFLSLPVYFSKIKFYTAICTPAIIASRMSGDYSINMNYIGYGFEYYKNAVFISSLVFVVLPLIFGLLYYNRSSVG